MTIEKPAIIVENVWKQYGVEKPAFLNKIQNGIKRISLKGNQPQNILWALQNFTTLGSESVGIVMGASNILTAMMSCIVAFFVVRQIKRQNKMMG